MATTKLSKAQINALWLCQGSGKEPAFMCRPSTWDSLCKMGLTSSFRENTLLYYRITDAGREALKKARGE